MSFSMNLGILIGRLATDVELRYTPSGAAVCSFTLAVDRQKKAAGEDKPKTDFMNVVAWHALAENCANYLVKGQVAIAVGPHQTRTYQDKDDRKVKVTEMIADNVIFGPKPNGANKGQENNLDVASVAGQMFGAMAGQMMGQGNQGSNSTAAPATAKNQGGAAKGNPQTTGGGFDFSDPAVEKGTFGNDPFTDGQPINIDDDSLPF